MLQASAFGTNERQALHDAVDDREETGEPFAPDEVREFVPFLPDPSSAADMSRKLTSFQRASLDAYFRVGAFTDESRDRVRLGTIHSAKGREADHVYVGTDLTEKVVEQMAATVDDPEDVTGVDEFTKTTDPVPTLTDNERRVFYVGMSRARERLVVLEDLIDGAPTLPVDVIINGELTGASAEAAAESVGAEARPTP
jgi:DNA helicase-2/ATP-dependent DNA helicase PcrA